MPAVKRVHGEPTGKRGLLPAEPRICHRKGSGLFLLIFIYFFCKLKKSPSLSHQSLAGPGAVGAQLWPERGSHECVEPTGRQPGPRPACVCLSVSASRGFLTLLCAPARGLGLRQTKGKPWGNGRDRNCFLELQGQGPGPGRRQGSSLAPEVLSEPGGSASEPRGFAFLKNIAGPWALRPQPSPGHGHWEVASSACAPKAIASPQVRGSHPGSCPHAGLSRKLSRLRPPAPPFPSRHSPCSPPKCEMLLRTGWGAPWSVLGRGTGSPVWGPKNSYTATPCTRGRYLVLPRTPAWRLPQRDHDFPYIYMCIYRESKRQYIYFFAYRSWGQTFLTS